MLTILFKNLTRKNSVCLAASLLIFLGYISNIFGQSSSFSLRPDLPAPQIQMAGLAVQDSGEMVMVSGLARKIKNCHIKPDLVPDIDPDTGIPLTVWITNERAPVLSCPESGTPTLIRHKFMGRFFLSEGARLVKKQETWRLLLVEKKGNQGNDYMAIGWIDTKNLLYDPYPIVNIFSNSDFKGLLISEYNHRSRVPVFSNPLLRGTPKSYFDRRSISFIYRLYPDRYEKDPPLELAGRVRSLLVSQNPLLNAVSKSADNSRIGWIDAKNLTIWGTDLSIRLFDRIYVYTDAKSAWYRKKSEIICNLGPVSQKRQPFPIPVIREENGMLKIPLSRRLCGTAKYKRFGWVNPDSERGQKKRRMELQFFIQKAELIRLMNLFSDLSESPPTPESVEMTWASLINDFTQEKCEPNRKYLQCFRQSIAVSYIPQKSQFIKYSLDDLVYLTLVNRRKFSDVFCDLKKSYLTLRGILSNEKITYRRVSGNHCEYKVVRRKTKQYWFKQNDYHFAWIALDDLP